jgi:hypothetical protein
MSSDGLSDVSVANVLLTFNDRAIIEEKAAIDAIPAELAAGIRPLPSPSPCSKDQWAGPYGCMTEEELRRVRGNSTTPGQRLRYLQDQNDGTMKFASYWGGWGTDSSRTWWQELTFQKAAPHRPVKLVQRLVDDDYGEVIHERERQFEPDGRASLLLAVEATSRTRYVPLGIRFVLSSKEPGGEIVEGTNGDSAIAVTITPGRQAVVVTRMSSGQVLRQGVGSDGVLSPEVVTTIDGREACRTRLGDTRDEVGRWWASPSPSPR